MKSLFRIYYQAIKKVPYLKYSLIIPVTAIILAFIAYLKLDNKSVFTYAFTVLFLTLLTSVCAKLAQSNDKAIKVAFYIITYCIVVTTGIAVVGFGAFILSGKPIFYEQWFPKKANSVLEKTKHLETQAEDSSMNHSLPKNSSDFDKTRNKSRVYSDKTKINRHIEVSIQLEPKSEGYASVLVNGKQTPLLSSSTRFNPRLNLKVDNTDRQITIITKSGDSCFTNLSSNSKQDFYRLIPNCK